MVVSRTAALTFVALMLGAHGPPNVTAASWRLVWQDEFRARDGGKPDPTKWGHEVGGHGWGNRELQYYTDRLENSQIRSGSLVIRAAKETYTGSDRVTRSFTSARLTSKGRFSAKYGRFEARIRLPGGKGLWSAFWMLGDDYDAVGWPRSGEIDILENVGDEPSAIHGTLHGPGYFREAGIASTYVLPRGRKVTDAFHVYAAEWESDAIRFYVDGHLYRTITRSDVPAGGVWVFDHPFFIIINLAVGGDWPGPPDESTTFPQTMLVDYVRVYQRP
jgi:beta-glucanase (GH16 family)